MTEVAMHAQRVANTVSSTILIQLCRSLLLLHQAQCLLSVFPHVTCDFQEESLVQELYEKQTDVPL
jgi:hypothetical protein